MRERYPEAFEADWNTSPGSRDKLGTFTYAALKDKIVFNLYTQHRYGIDRVHVDYDAVRDSLSAMRSYLEENCDYDQVKIGLPMIGCGLAGGDWDVVSKIVENTFEDKDVFVFVYDKGEFEKARQAGKRIIAAIEGMRVE
jgi:O-acetyl-ADP-ribose deacetylase (regulator of RNase III)